MSNEIDRARELVRFEVGNLSDREIDLFNEGMDAIHTKSNGVGIHRYDDPRQLSEGEFKDYIDFFAERIRDIGEGRPRYIPTDTDMMRSVGDVYGFVLHDDYAIVIDEEAANDIFDIVETYGHEQTHLWFGTNDEQFVYELNLMALNELSTTDKYGTDVQKLAEGAKITCLARGLNRDYFTSDTLEEIGYANPFSELGISLEEATSSGNSATAATVLMDGVGGFLEFLENIPRQYGGNLINTWTGMNLVSTRPDTSKWLTKLIKAMYSDYKSRIREVPKTHYTTTTPRLTFKERVEKIKNSKLGKYIKRKIGERTQRRRRHRTKFDVD